MYIMLSYLKDSGMRKVLLMPSRIIFIFFSDPAYCRLHFKNFIFLLFCSYMSVILKCATKRQDTVRYELRHFTRYSRLRHATDSVRDMPFLRGAPMPHDTQPGPKCRMRN